MPPSVLEKFAQIWADATRNDRAMGMELETDILESELHTVMEGHLAYQS